MNYYPRGYSTEAVNDDNAYVFTFHFIIFTQVKQITASLEEERNWAQELEIERDQFRDRLNGETKLREKLAMERDSEIDALRERIKELEEEAFRRENVVQQQKNEIAEKERLVKEKSLLLDETSRTCEEVSAVAEKRKKQIVQLRLSVKSRDDALTDLNNKHRTLLNQVIEFFYYLSLFYFYCKNSMRI